MEELGIFFFFGASHDCPLRSARLLSARLLACSHSTGGLQQFGCLKLAAAAFLSSLPSLVPFRTHSLGFALSLSPTIRHHRASRLHSRCRLPSVRTTTSSSQIQSVTAYSSSTADNSPPLPPSSCTARHETSRGPTCCQRAEGPPNTLLEDLKPSGRRLQHIPFRRRTPNFLVVESPDSYVGSQESSCNRWRPTDSEETRRRLGGLTAAKTLQQHDVIMILKLVCDQRLFEA